MDDINEKKWTEFEPVIKTHFRGILPFYQVSYSLPQRASEHT